MGGNFPSQLSDLEYVTWLIHVDKWQKPTQYFKAVILQLKINTLILKTTQKEKCDLVKVLQRTLTHKKSYETHVKSCEEEMTDPLEIL